MNTGVQRSGATPPAARTATTQAGRRRARATSFGQGKNAPLIAMAHEIPYVATATVADLRDLEAKVERAMEFRGARYLHVLRALPARLGHRASRDTIRIARLAKETGLFPVFEAERRRGHRASRRSAGRCRSRSTCGRSAATRTCSATRPRDRRDRAHPGARRPQHRALRPARRRGGVADERASRSRSRSTSARASPTRPASGAPSARSTSTALPPCNHACPAGENIQQLALPRRGAASYERAWRADHGGQPVPGDHGPRLLPPVRDRLQPRRSSTRRSASTRSSASSATRRSAAAGRVEVDAPRRRGKRVLVVGAGPVRAVGRLPPARGSATRSTIHDAGPAAGGMMRFGIPTLPAAARRPRRRGRSASSTSASTLELNTQGRRRRSTRCARAASTPPSSPSARTSASAPTSPPARRRRSSTRSRCCAAWRARSGRCSAGASSSTAAATRRWTPRAPPSASAPRRRSSSTAAPATGCPRTTSRSRRPSEEGVLMKWLSTIKHADERQARARADGARRDRLPAADRRARGARGRLARARARPGGRPLAARRRRRASRSTTASSQVGAEHDDRPPGDLRRRRHGARRAHGHRRRSATARRPRATSTPGCAARALRARRRSTSSPSFDELNTWYYADAPRTVQPAARARPPRSPRFDEVVGGLDESNALFEARRCLSCGNCFSCDNCYGVCPDNAVLKLGEPGEPLRDRPRLLQGLRPLRRRVPVRRDRDGARRRSDDERRRLGEDDRRRAHALRA